MNISATPTNFNQNITTSTTTKSNTYNKSVDANVENNTDVDKEQDAILYQRLKAAGCDLTNFSLEDQKKMIVSFPPLTAPGAVRKAYASALDNATPQEKKAVAGMSFYMYSYNKQTGTQTNLDNSVNNNVDGYLNLTNNFKGYFTQYQSALGDTEFKSFNNFLDNFTSELSKYNS